MSAPRLTDEQQERPMADELLHFSEKPLAHVYDVDQYGGRGYKPNGLWVSAGTSWAEWCLSEDYGTAQLRTVTRVVLVDDAKILYLPSVEDLDRFTWEYATREKRWSGDDSIDWQRVSEQFDGIIIAPYQWSRRHSLHWYYPWDVASGCIWKARTIASVESVDLAAEMSVSSVLAGGGAEER